MTIIPAARIPATVTGKLILPKIELKAFKCKLKIAKSTEILGFLLTGRRAAHASSP